METGNTNCFFSRPGRRMALLGIPLFMLLAVLVIQPKCGMATAVVLFLMFASPVVTMLLGIFALVRRRTLEDLLLALYSAVLLLCMIMLYGRSAI